MNIKASSFRNLAIPTVALLFSVVTTAHAVSPVTPYTPIDGGTYYNDEPLTISWPNIGFAGIIGLSLKTQAQESFPPAQGGTHALSVQGNATSHTITAYDMGGIPLNKYKVILACGEELCGETGYFDIKARPVVSIPATSTISVITNVINNDAGSAQASDFTISIDADNPSSTTFVGSINPVQIIFDAGEYTVTGSASTAYNLTYSEECGGTLAANVSAVCTVTYDDIFYVPNGGGQGGDNEGDGIIPNGQGGNDNEGNGIIPNGQGSNDNEGEGIIPNGQGSNGHEGDPIVQGSNDNEIIPPVIDTEQPVIAEAQSNSSSGSSSSSTFKRSVPSNILPILTDIGSCTYINDYLNINDKNNPTEVTKLQTFLLNTEGIDVGINGIFDESTLAAVKAFQTKYLDEVMLPWGLQTASGIVSYTTKKKINEIYCKSTFALTPAQLAAIERYRTSINLPDPDIEFQEPDAIEVGFAEPEIIEAPLITEQIEEVPVTPITQQTQTASALDAGDGFFKKIINFFKNIF